MTKPYEIYQYLEGEPMTGRDVKEAGSKFWNEGKWENFVVPFLPEDGSGMALVDMGCNAGLFLKLAEERGFQAIGVDSNEVAVRRGTEWRDKHGYQYQIINSTIQECIDELPVVDYTLWVNAHYYFTVPEWLEYLDKLQHKTLNCIIVTDEKKFINRCWASTDVKDIRSCLRNWKETGFIDLLPTDGDPSPRKLRSLCFQSWSLEKVPVASLDSSNHVQDRFYEQLDSGKTYLETGYYRILKKYRAKWGEGFLNRWVERKVELYEDIKRNGLKTAIIVDSADKILDGNHRYSMMRHLGHENIFVRRI